MAGTFSNLENLLDNPGNHFPISTYALGVYVQSLVLPRLFNRNVEQDFQGQRGFVVNVRKPATTAVETHNFRMRSSQDNSGGVLLENGTDGHTEVEFSDIPAGEYAQVTITDHLYNAIRITDEEATFKLEDFARQMLAPQALGVARRAEGIAAAVIDGLAADPGIPALEADGSNLREVVMAVTTEFDQRYIPRQGRQLLISPDLQRHFVLNENLLRFDASNSTEALRDAQVGRLLGFDVYVVNSLAPGTMLAFLQDAFTFVSRVPYAPRGATATAAQSVESIGMRWLADYDPKTLADRSVVSTFVGASVLDDRLYVKVEVEGAGS